MRHCNTKKLALKRTHDTGQLGSRRRWFVVRQWAHPHQFRRTAAAVGGDAGARGTFCSLLYLRAPEIKSSAKLDILGAVANSIRQWTGLARTARLVSTSRVHFAKKQAA